MGQRQPFDNIFHLCFAAVINCGALVCSCHILNYRTVTLSLALSRWGRRTQEDTGYRQTIRILKNFKFHKKSFKIKISSQSGGRDRAGNSSSFDLVKVCPRPPRGKGGGLAWAPAH